MVGLGRGDERKGGMAAVAVKQKRRVFNTEHAFEWAFAIGFALIFVAKLIVRGYPIAGGLVASMLGILVMWRYRADQSRSRPENERPRLGDEVYYLGLLYTLTSLCAALVSLFLLYGSEQTLEKRTDEMIGSFGIALSTTMAGIVMRMKLQRHTTEGKATIIRIPHPPGEPNEGGVNIEGVTVDLERYAYELRRQLQNSTNAFASHTNQSILQAKSIHSHLDEMMQAFHRGLEQKANDQLESLKAIYNEVAKKAEVAEHRTAAQQTGIHSALEKLETQVKSMDESVERMRAGSHETARNLESVSTKAQEMARAFAEGGKTVADGLHALAEAVESEREYDEVRKQFAAEMGEQLRRQAEEWAAVQQKVGEFLSDFTKSNEALSRLGEEAKRTNNELAALPEGVTRAKQSIEQLAEITSAGDAIAGLNVKVGKLTEQLAGISAAGARHEEALEKSIEKLNSLAEIAGQEFDGRAKLKEAAGDIAEVASKAGHHAEGLKDAEREIQQINTGLRDIQAVLRDDGFRLAEVLKEAIAAFEEAKANGSGRGIRRRWFFGK